MPVEQDRVDASVHRLAVLLQLDLRRRQIVVRPAAYARRLVARDVDVHRPAVDLVLRAGVLARQEYHGRGAQPVQSYARADVRAIALALSGACVHSDVVLRAVEHLEGHVVLDLSSATTKATVPSDDLPVSHVDIFPRFFGVVVSVLVDLSASDGHQLVAAGTDRLLPVIQVASVDVQLVREPGTLALQPDGAVDRQLTLRSESDRRGGLVHPDDSVEDVRPVLSHFFHYGVQLVLEGNLVYAEAGHQLDRELVLQTDDQQGDGCDVMG